jgi:hypothetical protein
VNLAPLVISWVVLALVVAAFAGLRYRAGTREDLTIHLQAQEGPAAAWQVKAFRRLRRIETWGKTLTGVAVVYGLILAAVYLYHVAQQSVQLPK